MSNWWDSAPTLSEHAAGAAVAAPDAPVGGGNWWESSPVVGAPAKVDGDRPQSAQSDDRPGVAEDIAKASGTGLLKGVVGLLGLPVDAYNAAGRAGTWVGDKLGQLTTGKTLPDAPAPTIPGGSGDMQRVVEGVTGPFYKAQTGPGQYAETVASLVPGAILGGGGVVSNVAKYAVIPGVASEAAGQAAAGTEWEPAARAGAALATGGAAAVLSRPNNAGRIIKDALDNVTDQQLASATRLMHEAEAAGMPLSVPEAVQYVTNGATRLGDIQRVVEASRKGGPVMKEFYAGRPAGNDAGVRQSLDNIAPPNPAPTEIAPRVQRAASGELADTRKAINDAARPYYEAAENATPPSQDVVGRTIGARADLTPLVSDPQVKAAIAAARSHPVLGAELKDLPDDAFRVLDAAKKVSDDAAASARAGGQNEAASAWGGVAERIRTAASQATPDAYPTYATARQIGREGREQVLGPLERSPTGQLAAAETFPEQAKILLNPNPLPNSQAQVSGAVRAVAARDPDAARDLVRTYLEQVFNETTQRLQSGANQWGGAKYAAVIAGNPQQAKNLAAAMQALPEGNSAYAGFRRVLEVLEAQGYRQPVGSQTEFNRLLTEDLRKGGAGEIPALVGSPTKLASFLSQAYADMRYGKNTQKLAELFTSPDGIAEAAKLAKLSPKSPEARALVAKLLANTYTASNAAVPAAGAAR